MRDTYTGWRTCRRSEPEACCVEGASATDGTIGVRDSKAGGAGPVLEFGRREWAAFVGSVRGSGAAG